MLSIWCGIEWCSCQNGQRVYHVVPKRCEIEYCCCPCCVSSNDVVSKRCKIVVLRSDRLRKILPGMPIYFCESVLFCGGVSICKGILFAKAMSLWNFYYVAQVFGFAWLCEGILICKGVVLCQGGELVRAFYVTKIHFAEASLLRKLMNGLARQVP